MFARHRKEERGGNSSFEKPQRQSALDKRGGRRRKGKIPIESSRAAEQVGNARAEKGRDRLTTQRKGGTTISADA